MFELGDELSQTSDPTVPVSTDGFTYRSLFFSRWLAVPLKVLFLVGFSFVFLAGCTYSMNSYYVQSQAYDHVVIQADHDVSLLYGDLYQAQDKLGMEHRGGPLQVHFVPGQRESPITGWKGEYFESDDFQGVVLGKSSPGEVTLYMTDGNYRRETSIHEMKHQILYSHGIHGRKHHDIIWDLGD